jgi:alpha-beta hydrolase superfamily lysophospholipase
MITTKDIWLTLNSEQKFEKMREVLTQLKLIDEGKHPLHNLTKQGRLAAVKKDLEKFVINALSWESDRQTSRY